MAERVKEKFVKDSDLVDFAIGVGELGTKKPGVG